MLPIPEILVNLPDAFLYPNSYHKWKTLYIKSINIIVSYIADVILEAKGGNKDNQEKELNSNSIELEEESK